ncbi:Hypothetical predicted protein, partial [Scomber scombrus]
DEEVSILSAVHNVAYSQANKKLICNNVPSLQNNYPTMLLVKPGKTQDGAVEKGEKLKVHQKKRVLDPTSNQKAGTLKRKIQQRRVTAGWTVKDEPLHMNVSNQDGGFLQAENRQRLFRET